jgi:hypothetical protein
MLSKEKRGKRTGDEEQGQALVEFAFVAIFLFLVLFGVMDFARLFFAYATMSNGAREGARYGIVHPGEDTTIEQRTLGMLVLIGGEANVTVNYPGRDDGQEPGCTTPHRCRIEVVVTSTLDVWTPIIPALPVEARATMHFE